MPAHRSRLIARLVALALLLAGLAALPARAQQPSVHLALGNPSGAAVDPALPNNYLIERAEYALAYSRDRGTPSWVSWHLDAADLGEVPRYEGEFFTDTSLPAGWYRVTHDDYLNTQYDRGHMAPSADRTASEAANEATFIMTNVVPQAPPNNRGPWAQLESYARDQVEAGSNEAYIVAGPVGAVGTIAGGRVTVPEAVWKLIVVLPVGDDDAARVTAETTLIAVIMPNDATVQGRPWESFRTTLRCIEERTGLDLLGAVDPAVQAALEGAGCPLASGARLFLPLVRGAGEAPPPPPPADVRIVAVEFDPEGPDLDGEHVLIANRGQGPATLTGWTLLDAAELVYTFPAFTLAAGAEVRVWVKDGADDAANLYWGRGSPVWNNAGDTATLRDAAGELVSELTYP